MRILHIKPETACAKMSVFCSFCVHHVTLNGRAVKSNVLPAPLLQAAGLLLTCGTAGGIIMLSAKIVPPGIGILLQEAEERQDPANMGAKDPEGRKQLCCWSKTVI